MNPVWLRVPRVLHVLLAHVHSVLLTSLPPPAGGALQTQ